MSRKHHNYNLPAQLKTYANSRTLDFRQYSPWHVKIIDADYTIVNLWTTSKYWIELTSYADQTDQLIAERAGEKGPLPTKYKKLEKFLDGIFYAAYKA